MAKKTESNPFDFNTEVELNASESRKLDMTPILIGTSNTRAQELMVKVSKTPELFELANTAIDGGQPQDLIDLIKAVYSDEDIHADSMILNGANDDQLSRLLESRRSDRSKAKAKGPRKNITVCKTYIAAMYAEMLIREYWQKPYAGTSSLPTDIKALAEDQEALVAKIRSLQSKKSRLKKLAGYDIEAKTELEEVEDEIERLNALRPTTRVVTKTVIKDMGADQLRSLLKAIDPETLPEAEQQKYTDLMAKLG